MLAICFNEKSPIVFYDFQYQLTDKSMNLLFHTLYLLLFFFCLANHNIYFAPNSYS